MRIIRWIWIEKKGNPSDRSKYLFIRMEDAIQDCIMLLAIRKIGYILSFSWMHLRIRKCRLGIVAKCQMPNAIFSITRFCNNFAKTNEEIRKFFVQSIYSYSLMIRIVTTHCRLVSLFIQRNSGLTNSNSVNKTKRISFQYRVALSCG